MKFTIEGFSQAYAMTLKKNVASKGKEKLIKIDCTDLVILRWFVDFYPNAEKRLVDGQEYLWLSHKKLMEDLPLLDISKRACIERMQKLVEFGILKYKLVKEGGTYSLYTFGVNYMNLIRSNDTGADAQSTDGMRSTDRGVVRSNSIGVCGQPTNKDTSIKDSSIQTLNKKERKISFDSIISEYTTDSETVDLLQEWLKARKAKKAAMTDRAIQMNIAKLDNLASESGMTVKQYLSEVICRGWAAFYEIKQYGQQSKSGTINGTVETINGKQYTKKDGKYYLVGGLGIAVDPFAKDDNLPF